MKILGWIAALSLILVGWAGNASTDPDKAYYRSSYWY